MESVMAALWKLQHWKLALSEGELMVTQSGNILIKGERKKFLKNS